MAASDYITASCASSATNPAEWYDYSNACVEVDARFHAIGLSLVGHKITCPTSSTELTNAQNAKTFKVITGITGTLNDPTKNTEDLSNFSCRSSETIIDFTYSISMEVLENPDNWKFWNALAENGDLVEEMIWVNKSGIAYEIPGKPSISVGQGVNGRLGVMKLEITWNTKSLPRPYKALASIFACT